MGEQHPQRQSGRPQRALYTARCLQGAKEAPASAQSVPSAACSEPEAACASQCSEANLRAYPCRSSRPVAFVQGASLGACKGTQLPPRMLSRCYSGPCRRLQQFGTCRLTVKRDCIALVSLLRLY